MSRHHSKLREKQKLKTSKRKSAQNFPNLTRIFQVISLTAALSCLFLRVSAARVATSPLPPLEKSNVVPKFKIENQGNMLDSVHIECILNGPDFENVHLSNVIILSGRQGAMAFDRLSRGASVSTSCGIKATHFAEGTQLQLHITYNVAPLKIPHSSDSYFRLVYDANGQPRWDPDAGHPST